MITQSGKRVPEPSAWEDKSAPLFSIIIMFIRTLYTNTAGSTWVLYSGGKNSSHAGFLPTAFVGGSYFFNDVVGVNAEFGYNFAYAAIGVNFRIVK
jgi:hypothetical protein